MMQHDTYHFWGMHVMWWFIWMILLFWIFAIPYNIPGQRAKKDTSLDILKTRFANGDIDKKEFEEKKKILKDS